ncbi:MULTISPECIES: KAP family P-loop NTPase fold protein [Robinsoniella]|uniref:KAP family P-loop NTPase fold protein n=1 Tax=Robinsoniella TaxID=588605 RepID=UPI00048824BF|nr:MULTISPECIES: P-loop NTPase fold protein [Robinsoniella]
MRKLSFETDDKLGRLEYAKFLKTIILNSDQYKRDLLTNAYTIAVDSPWGTGKSYFFNMFMNYCEDIDDLKVIYYNAWENDFWDNPFDPFMNTILEDGIFQLQIDNDNAANLGGKILIAAQNIGYGFVRTKMEKHFNIDIPADLDTLEAFKGYLKGENSFFGEYKLFRKNISEMKEIMTTYMDNSKRKLVIIVDELDRCKPNFAIQTLEIVKHLFDVKDMVFVFAVDISQLSCSIKTVYGQDMDSTGYLCRFFDYISKIPKTDSSDIILNRLNIVKWNNKHRNDDKFKDKIKMFFSHMQAHFILTLRDLDTVLKTYMIMYDVFLKDYLLVTSHFNYIYFMIMKYKKIEMYNSILDKQYKITQEEESKKISEKFKFYEGIEGIVIILQMANYVIDDLVKDECGKDIGIEKILFDPDYEIYDEISGLLYGQYIYQKLEMFNYMSENSENLLSTSL